MSNQPRAKRAKSGRTFTGTVQANRRGFGFVRPINARQQSEEDVFLPSSLMNGILDGDTVEVILSGGNARSVRRITRVRSKVFGLVTDGVFNSDPGVGSLTFKLNGLYAKDEVVSVQINDINGECKPGMVTRFGSLDNPVTLATLILARHLLPLDHSNSAIDQANRTVLSVKRNKYNPRRRDLRGQLSLTVDAPESEDLDDAISASVDPDGHIRVWVHISDVSEYITTNSILDQDAYNTPTSIYFPDFVRPMLPPALSHNALSLLPGVERNTLTVEMRISPNGIISSVDVYEATIATRTRLSYTTVARVLEGRRGHEIGALPDEDLSLEVVDTIGWLWAAAARLGQSRTARGGVDAFRLDYSGSEESRDDNSHKLIERLMVAANESVAEWLTERGIPALYRIHESITDTQAEELEKIANGFGIKAHLGRPVTAQAFAAFAATIDTSRSQALWNAILTLLGRASYSTNSTGHFGLGADSYLHFTSPIRRYADLRIHRLVKQYLNGDRDFAYLRPDLDAVADTINPKLQRADQAMREAERSSGLLKVGISLEEESKRSWNGVITDITARGLTVSTPSIPVSTFVPTRALGRGRHLDTTRRLLVNSDGSTLGIGSKVELFITDINVLAARIVGSLEPGTTHNSNNGKKRYTRKTATSRNGKSIDIPISKTTNPLTPTNSSKILKSANRRSPKNKNSTTIISIPLQSNKTIDKNSSSIDKTASSSIIFRSAPTLASENKSKIIADDAKKIVKNSRAERRRRMNKRAQRPSL